MLIVALAMMMMAAGGPLAPGEAVIINPITGKSRHVHVTRPEDLPLNVPKIDRGTFIDPARPESANGAFDSHFGDPYPCGGVLTLKKWGSPPKGVQQLLAICRNGQAYVITQELTNFGFRVQRAERVKH